MKKRLQNIIKNERGFGNPIEGLVIIAIIGIIAAIAIPPFVKMFEKRSAAEDVTCIQTMIAIAQGSESTQATCPVSELEYEPHIDNSQISVSCPDPEPHLLSSPQVVDTDQGLIFNQTLPELNYAKSGNRVIADRTVLADLAEVVVVTEKMGWGGYLIVGLIILALLSSLIKGITALMLEKTPSDGLAIVLIWAIVCLVGGFFFHRAFIKQEYRFSKSDRTVSVHDLYAGEKFSDPEIFNDIVAVVPLRIGKDRMTVALLYETPEGIRHSKLFRMDNERLAIVTLLNHALFQGESPIITSVEQPAQQTESAEETKGSKEEDPGFFKTLKSLLSGKRNKPYRPNLKYIPKPDIPKPKVVRPQFKVQPGVNPGDDVFRRHQMEQEYLRNRQMEALRMQQQQQQEIQRRQLYYDQFRN